MSCFKPFFLTAVAITFTLEHMFGFLPSNWIESALGATPDAGNGMLELFLILIPIACYIAYVLASCRQSRKVTRVDAIK